LFAVPTIDFIYFDAGGGHRAAATALKQIVDQQQRPWTIRLVNLQEILDPLDIFRKITGIRLEDIYNLLLSKGWTLGSAQLLRFMHGVIRVYHRPTVKLLERYWRETRPDAVVSLVPNFNRALLESLRRAAPSTPYVTVMTDFADYPPHFWIERQDQFLVCGTPRAAEQARAMGYEDDRILRTSGMILRPEFYSPPSIDRDAEMRRIGLDPQLPTGIVLFGGQGSRVMLDIARRLSASDLDVQLIMICGRNQKLARRLRSMPSRIGLHVEEFTKEIPYFMQLADFLIGKPGPGSISEAVAMKLPVIIECNAWTLPQERYNAEWVTEQRAGIVLRSFRDVVDGVRKLLAPGALATHRANAAAIQNRALFEIAEILEQLTTSIK
jgi:hypothetical protein